MDVTGGHRYGSIVRRVSGLVLVFHFLSGLQPGLLVLQFLFGLQPVLFTLALPATLLDVNLIRMLGNVFLRQHGGSDRPRMRSVKHLLGDEYFPAFRLVVVLIHRRSLLSNRTSWDTLLHAPCGELQIPVRLRRRSELLCPRDPISGELHLLGINPYDPDPPHSVARPKNLVDSFNHAKASALRSAGDRLDHTQLRLALLRLPQIIRNGANLLLQIPLMLGYRVQSCLFVRLQLLRMHLQRRVQAAHQDQKLARLSLEQGNLPSVHSRSASASAESPRSAGGAPFRDTVLLIHRVTQKRGVGAEGKDIVGGVEIARRVQLVPMHLGELHPECPLGPAEPGRGLTGVLLHRSRTLPLVPLLHLLPLLPGHLLDLRKTVLLSAN